MYVAWNARPLATERCTGGAACAAYVRHMCGGHLQHDSQVLLDERLERTVLAGHTLEAVHLVRVRVGLPVAKVRLRLRG